jgi:hypothetical protein
VGESDSTAVDQLFIHFSKSISQFTGNRSKWRRPYF